MELRACINQKETLKVCLKNKMGMEIDTAAWKVIISTAIVLFSLRRELKKILSKMNECRHLISWLLGLHVNIILNNLSKFF